MVKNKRGYSARCREKKVKRDETVFSLQESLSSVDGPRLDGAHTVVFEMYAGLDEVVERSRGRDGSAAEAKRHERAREGEFFRVRTEKRGSGAKMSLVEFLREHESELRDCNCGKMGVTPGYACTWDCESQKSFREVFNEWQKKDSDGQRFRKTWCAEEERSD